MDVIGLLSRCYSQIEVITFKTWGFAEKANINFWFVNEFYDYVLFDFEIMAGSLYYVDGDVWFLWEMIIIRI